MNEVTENIYRHVCQLDPDQKEFQQAVYTFLLSMDKVIDELPEVKYHKVLERMVEPERAASRSTGDSGSSSHPQSDPIRAVSDSTPP